MKQDKAGKDASHDGKDTPRPYQKPEVKPRGQIRPVLLGSPPPPPTKPPPPGGTFFSFS